VVRPDFRVIFITTFILMVPKEIDILIDKYLEGQASVEEIAALDTWYNSFDDKQSLTELVGEEIMRKWKQLSLRKLMERLD
jgi:hypothetical protein